MPTESADVQYTAGAEAAKYPFRTNMADPEDRATAQEQVDAFAEYEARSDIEPRADILARETALPGSITWNDDGTFTVTTPTP
jgi:hypothetical protein